MNESITELFSRLESSVSARDKNALLRLELNKKKLDECMERISAYPISVMIRRWILTLKNVDTQHNYCAYMENIRKAPGVITHDGEYKYLTIKEFCARNHVDVLIKIASGKNWKKATKEARIACYRALCKYLKEEGTLYFPELDIDDAILSESLSCRKCSLGMIVNNEYAYNLAKTIDLANRDSMEEAR